jgi:subtilisin family serine protease
MAMATSYPVRQYIVFDARQLLGRPVISPLEPGEVEKALVAALGSGLRFTVESLPTARFVPYEHVKTPFIPESVAVLVSPSEADARAVRDAVEDLIAREGGKRISDIGADPAIGLADYSFPGSVDVGLFGTRDEAHRLVGIDRLPGGLNLTGNGVNVIVVDSGLDASLIPFGQWGGGWQPLPSGPVPGTTTGESALHGTMVVQNILEVARQARIWDLPLIPPPRINEIGGFLASAQATFSMMIQNIQQIQNLPGGPQQWVFMNAWAIFDRRSEFVFGDYTENRPGQAGPHPFIALIEQLAQRFDIIFCAGNCGGVCPDGRCGPNDYGPGRDIWGANAHPSVLTVGATRTDYSWIGYSSEGPGPCIKLASQKPDLCAPSQFAETSGGFPPNLGTSAASALAAGVIAAFRSNWPQSAVSPARMINRLNTTVQQVNGPFWTRRFGFGVLDASAAAAALP